jgi:recombination protein RecR
MEYPESFKNLIDAFARLPGVGYKSAERMAYAYLDLLPEYKEKFVSSLSNVNKIKHCHVCHNLSDEDECEICKNKNRDESLICVVSNPKDVFAIEKTNSFNGKYHVLNGVISLKKGKLPQDLNIDSLLTRLDGVKEVIVATNPNLDGETTGLFIAKLLEGKDIKVTRLAYGLPVGASLDYADEFTLIKAMQGRRKL